MGEAVLQEIRDLLARSRVAFREIGHAPIRTSAQAARARGCPLRMGAKSIVLKVDDRFELFVLSAACEVRSRILRRRLGARRTRFATPSELLRLTGLEPGEVPPFGEPILPLRLRADPRLLANRRIAFTPGVRSLSIVLDSADYLRVARPDVVAFAEPLSG